MKRANFFGVVFVVLLALAGLAASAAFAESHLPLLLPSTTHGYTFAATGTLSLRFLSGAVIECEKVIGSGTEATDELGSYTSDFEKCVKSGNVCTGSGEAAGTILSSGEYHFVFDSLTTLGAAILFLTKQTEFLCGGEFAKTVFKAGQVLCLISEPTVSKTTHTAKCEMTAGGDPVASETKWWNDSGVEQKAGLICSFSGIEVSCGFLATFTVTNEEAKGWELV
jgi:hypothetical protein